MAITAKDVMDLRNKTSLGMMECKAALEEAGGDPQKAHDILRKKGLAKMDSRADRTSAEGRVAVAVTPDKIKGAILEVNTETDFTAKSDVFTQMMQCLAAEALKQAAGEVVVTDVMRAAIDDVRIKTKENVQFARGRVVGGTPASRVGAYAHFTGKVATVVELDLAGLAEGGAVGDELLQDLCMHVTAISPTPIGINESDIPAAVIEKEKEIAKAQAIEQGKPEAIAEKMVTGKLRKFFEEHLLPMQLFVKDDKKRVKDILPKGVTIRAFVRYQVGVK